MHLNKLGVCVLFCATATLQPLLALADTVPNNLQAEITQVLKSRLGPPASTQINFETFRRTENGAIVCGEVGSHGGQQSFYFIKVNTTGALTGSVVGTEQERDMASMVCG